MNNILDNISAVVTSAVPADDAAKVAERYLALKDVEAAAKKATEQRKQDGKVLQSLLGNGGTVTVNRGGFRTYELRVSPRKAPVSANAALDRMVEDGIITLEQRNAYLEASRGEGTEVISLKALKV